MNVIFFESKGLSNLYGIGTYKTVLLSELDNFKEIKIYCINISISSKPALNIESSTSNRITYISFKFPNFSHTSSKVFTYEKYIFNTYKVAISVLQQVFNISEGIIHLNTASDLNIAKIGKTKGFKVIATQHVALRENNTINIYQDKKYNKINSDFLKILDGCIFLCKDNLNIAKDMFRIHEKKTALIYNGIELGSTEIQEKTRIKADLGLTSESFIILFAGRLDKNKGLIELIKAFNDFSTSHKNAKLILCGDVNSDIFEYTFNNLDNIIITGFLHREKLEKLYSIADIGVLPSYSEQSSFSVLEMMKYNIPVVGTEIGGFEIFKTNHHILKAKFINSNTRYIHISSLSSHFEQLYNNPALRDKLITNSKKLIKDELNSKKMANKTAEFYKKIYYAYN